MPYNSGDRSSSVVLIRNQMTLQVKEFPSPSSGVGGPFQTGGVAGDGFQLAATLGTLQLTMTGQEEESKAVVAPALNILNEIPSVTRKKLACKGYHPQNGLIMQFFPVPPNCLYSPDYRDGQSIMSSDVSLSLLKRVLRKIEDIKRSRSGPPNFQSHEIESSELHKVILQYMRLRGTQKVPIDVTRKMLCLDKTAVSTKQWSEKIRTLFIRKSSGFSSRSVITGDTYKGVDEIGLPLDIATKITIEEKVTTSNIKRLQEVVDNGECLTYRDGLSTYAITVGSLGRTYLKVGQVVNRRIMDGDVIFVNRPPSTHKHSLQAFSVYVHSDHTVKINPLICSPLGADFDGDCIHIFYPQSFSSRAEALELFSVEKQLLSSHTGTLNLQLAQDSLLSLRLMQKTYFLRKNIAQQLGMFTCASLPPPALITTPNSGPFWTVLQILQSALPLHCCEQSYLIQKGEILLLDFEGGALQPAISDIVSSILFLHGQRDALMFFNTLQPLLMEFLFLEGFSVTLIDFNIPKVVKNSIRRNVQSILPHLHHVRETYNEFVDSQVENDMKKVKFSVTDFILRCSSLGNLVDLKGDSTISKIIQQVGFLGLQLAKRGKLYSPSLVDDVFSCFLNKYAVEVVDCPAKAYGLIGNSFFDGLDPYDVLVHSINTREVIVRSSRGLTEPGTLFKNLMSVLRDVVICYDGTARNVCTDSIVLFEYGVVDGKSTLSCVPAGEPVGVLAATAVSNLAYKAVLDSSQIANISWELMKEALLCKVNLKNDTAGRRMILYMNDCSCGKRFCKEKAAYAVYNSLRKVTLRDVAVDFSITYQNEYSESAPVLTGHIHLSQSLLDGLNCNMDDICKKCFNILRNRQKKKDGISAIFRKITLKSNWNPQKSNSQVSKSLCIQFSYQVPNAVTCIEPEDGIIDIMINAICPILLGAVIKGDPRLLSARVIWIGPDTIPRVGKSCKAMKGEVAVEVVIEKSAVKQAGDVWRVALDTCLPVMHLVDTRRSIPYGIQQIQNYLGISAAFDQAIQRLSTAVRSISKGVLRQHLILVTHSMTCTGNVIGFNTAGFKALFRARKVQAPFTEATLFTPLKCFEKAADKNHMDSLSSVVSACSWGKRVVTGTGTHFQVMWGNQISNIQDGGKDVYSFLHMVREISTAKSTAYLGVDVDNLDELVREQVAMSSDSSPRNQDVTRSPLPSDAIPWNQDITESHAYRQESPIWGSSISKNKSEAVDTPLPSSSQFGRCDEDAGWTKWPLHDASGNKSDLTNWDKSEKENKYGGKDQDVTWCPVSSDAIPWNQDTTKSHAYRQESPIWGSSISKNKSNAVDTPFPSSSQSERCDEDAGWTKWPLDDASGNKSGLTNWDKSERENEYGGSRKYWTSSSTHVTQSSQNTDCTAIYSTHASLTKPDAWISKRSDEVSTVKSADSGWDNKLQDRGDCPVKSRGWSSWNNTDRLANRKHSDVTQFGVVTGSSKSTRRHVDIFGIEEEKIFSEVELIMQSVKQILHSSYHDGDRLSASDQSYILDNVFQYHPDKNSKVIGEVECIMVDRHKSFPDSRCFFVVSTDGSSTDFSYIKCMESFVKEKYPENAESFNRKYFRRRGGDANATTMESHQT